MPKFMLRKLRLDRNGYDQWGCPWDKRQESRLYEYGPSLDQDGGRTDVLNAPTRRMAKVMIMKRHDNNVSFWR
jgi:hypothetical protein